MRKRTLFFYVFFSLQVKPFLAPTPDFFNLLATEAVKQTKLKVNYVPDYVVISYPNGDVPANTGVCTDLVIRAYRGVGIDLQKEVHEDMKLHFDKYPKFWKVKGTDRNIDHRRVPNLMVYLTRKNAAVKVTNNASDYKPGDVVIWNLSGGKTMGGITHIGIISHIASSSGNRYLVAHNIGGGNVLEDMLFAYPIIGHYRFGKKDSIGSDL